MIGNIVVGNTIVGRQKELQRQVEVDGRVRVANCTSVYCTVGSDIVEWLGIQLGTLFEGADNNRTSMWAWNTCCLPDSTTATVLCNVDQVFDRNPSCWLDWRRGDIKLQAGLSPLLPAAVWVFLKFQFGPWLFLKIRRRSWLFLKFPQHFGDAPELGSAD
jgi:hypothetical protein